MQKAGPPTFGKLREQALRQYLRYLGHQHAVLGYHELQGLLYAVSCAPEPMVEPEWLELVWLQDAPAVEDDSAAMDIVAFRHLLEELRQHIASSARQGQHLPFPDVPDDQQLTRIARWCDGFLLGHHHLEVVWDRALSGLGDPSLERIISRAIMAAGRLAGWQLGRRPLEDRGQKLRCYRRLQQRLHIYHSVHARWQALPGRSLLVAGFEGEVPAASEPCYCGSGRAFGRCCLH